MCVHPWAARAVGVHRCVCTDCPSHHAHLASYRHPPTPMPTHLLRAPHSGRQRLSHTPHLLLRRRHLKMVVAWGAHALHDRRNTTQVRAAEGAWAGEAPGTHPHPHNTPTHAHRYSPTLPALQADATPTSPPAFCCLIILPHTLRPLPQPYKNTYLVLEGFLPLVAGRRPSSSVVALSGALCMGAACTTCSGLSMAKKGC